jgi:hypothetical protein
VLKCASSLDNKTIGGLGQTLATDTRKMAAMKLRENFDTPSKFASQPWSPAGKKAWRDYADYAPELREYNEQKKAMRSQVQEPARARSRSRSARSPSPDEELSHAHSPLSEIPHTPSTSSWRLSYQTSISRRTQVQLKQVRMKRVGQLPVFSGMETFTLRNMGITHLEGMGVHREIRNVFLQQNFLTSFEGWEHQPHLMELHASDNFIESFKSVLPTPC